MAFLMSILTIFFLMFYGKFNSLSEKYLFLFLVNIVSSSNNITQFDNYTIEWLNFSLFTCAVPAEINVSLFNCISPNYTQVDDISCLQETNVVFQETTCQSTATTTTVNIISSKNVIILLETNALLEGSISNSQKKIFLAI